MTSSGWRRLYVAFALSAAIYGVMFTLMHAAWSAAPSWALVGIFLTMAYFDVRP